MAIQCTHCGTVLKDSARFCNICGTLVPSHPLNAKLNVSPPPASAQFDNSEERMHEPVPQRPSSRPTGRTLPDEPPDWMHQLAKGVPASVPPNSDSDVPQLAFPSQVPEIPITSSPRELRVKVWKEGQPTTMTDQDAHTQVNQKQRLVDDNEVENLPTRPLIAQTSNMLKPHQPINTSSPKGQVALSDNVDQLDTVPMVTHASVRPKPITRSVADEQQRQPWQEQDKAPAYTTVQRQSSTASPPPQRTTGGFVQDFQTPLSEVSTHNLRQTPPPLVAVPPTRRREKRKSRKSMAVVLAALLLLIVGGGLAMWLVLYQPFTVAGVTQPQQTFTNTQLGVSLHYPSGWTARVEAQKSTVHLTDSSQTARFTVVFTSTGGGDINKYLQQEAALLTMTAQKPGAAQTFAGTSWQQLQGNVLLNGATYTETLYAAVHQQKVCTIMQLAPQTTYAQEEQYVFSAMRSSFQFVA